MDEFVKFNLYEGSFWILFGVICYILYKLVPFRYKKISSATSSIFTLFGVSDFVEVKMGGFLYPLIWWLLIWKVVCVIGIIFVIGWYFKLRLKNN